MKSEPLLFEKIYQENLILPSGDRILFNNHDNVDLEYKSNKNLISIPVSFDLYIESANLKNFDKPYMIFADCFECPQMSSIKYPETTRSFLNDNGLHIFLAENIIKYDGQRVFVNRDNYREEISKLENNIGMKYGTFNSPRAFQFDSIRDLIENNNLTNVTVYAPEKNLEKIFTDLNFKIVYKDIDISKHLRKMRVIEIPKNKKVVYTFVNYNWRYEPFRHVIASYLANHNSKISWYFSAEEEIFIKSLWFNLKDLKGDQLISGFRKLNSRVPLNLDYHLDQPIQLQGNIHDRFKLPIEGVLPYTLNHNMFKDAFCAVVNESVYIDPCSNISDKTINAILHRMPFIIVGPPGALKILKDYEFKTFSDFWDESYDDEQDHVKRILKIFDLIDSLSCLSLDRLESMLLDMADTLEYNIDNFKNLQEIRRNGGTI